MLLIWRGYGWATLLVMVLVLFASQFGLKAVLSQEYFSENEWPWLFSMTISSISVALFGYYLNYKKRIVSINEETGVKTKLPTHTMFFIPVEYWGVIFAVLFAWVHINGIEQDAADIAYLEAPKVSDRYLVDFSKLYDDYDSKYIYGAMEVSYVNNTAVEVVISKKAYTKKAGVRKDLRGGEMVSRGYFDSTSSSFTIDTLLTLKDRDVIFEVSRGLGF